MNIKILGFWRSSPRLTKLADKNLACPARNEFAESETHLMAGNNIMLKEKPIPACPGRQLAHNRLDQFLDLAEEERLWGEVTVSVKIQNGKIVKVDFAPSLGEKVES